MNVLDPRIAHQEIDQRLRAAESRRRVRWARAAARSSGAHAFQGRAED